MDTELVTVTEVFEFAHGRVVIADEFFHDFDGRAAPFELDVLVVSPDGDSVPMTATISQPLIHARPPRAPGFVCMFDDASKSAFPVGSRIVLPSA